MITKKRKMIHCKITRLVDETLLYKLENDHRVISSRPKYYKYKPYRHAG